MPLELRTRITLLLPAPITLAQHYLVHDIFSELVDFGGGLTVSANNPVVYNGWWFDEVDKTIKEDEILMVTSDILVRATDSDLLDYLDELKKKCQQDFIQDIIWITIEEVKRVTTDDFIK